MRSQDCWALFLETGAPELYILYNQVRRMEEQNVFDGSGIGSADRRLQ